MRKQWGTILGTLAFCLLPIQGSAADKTPDFQEVFGLVRSNLTSLSPVEINQAAVSGLILQLNGMASLTKETSESSSTAPSIAQTNLFEGAYAYVRLARIAVGSGDQIKSCLQNLSASNRLKGLVLDLRFAAGDDYDAAAQVADGFVSDEQTLLKWGDISAKSKAKTNAFALPVAVLINKETAGAGEALAAALRQVKTGLLIGSATAGRAYIARDFALSNGQQLRLAVNPVYLGNGELVGIAGIKPDIQVQVNAADEKAYFADAFKAVASPGVDIGILPIEGEEVAKTVAGTNRPARHRVNEAELVRLQKENPNAESEGSVRSGTDAETANLVIQDPVLARAIDLLKGLALVKRLK